jgi:hypothetical protein
MQLAGSTTAAGELHRSFAAKNAAQDDRASLLSQSFTRAANTHGNLFVQLASK